VKKFDYIEKGHGILCIGISKDNKRLVASATNGLVLVSLETKLPNYAEPGIGKKWRGGRKGKQNIENGRPASFSDYWDSMNVFVSGSYLITEDMYIAIYVGMGMKDMYIAI